MYIYAVMVMSASTAPSKQAASVFLQAGGMLRTQQALERGVHPRTLYAMHESGQLERLSRGLYRLSVLPPLEDPDLAVVSTRVPQAVVCLISALSLHELTTEIPHAVYVALPRNMPAPQLDHPPLEVFRFSEPYLSLGVEEREQDGFRLRLYDPEKTLVDCFRMRGRIGVSTAVEALRLYRESPTAQPGKVLEYAEQCRAATVLRPYLEALF